MKAVVIEAFGAPETLKVREFPTPQPGLKDILIEVQAAGVCHHDVLHRAGKLPGAKAGVVPGHETAGRIVGIGADVTTHAVGDRVVVYQRRFCGECRNCLRGRQDLCRAMGAPAVDTEGGYAQFICVPSNMGIKIPDGVDWASAALASCPIGTSLRALKTVAGINPGDSVLITGAKSLGAETVVVSPDLQFSAQVWKATGKRGVDIAIDNVGSTLPETLRCVTQGGIVVVLGNVGGEAVPVSPGLLIGRRVRVVGSGMAPLDELYQSLAMLDAGLVKAVISETVTFPEAARAHALLESRSVQGRVVMQGW